MYIRIVKLFFIFLIPFKRYCQYDFIVNSLLIKKPTLEINKLKGKFDLYKSPNSNFTDSRNYKYSNSKKIELLFVENDSNSGCDTFIVFGKKIGIKGKLENDWLSCPLDVTSFEVFTFELRNNRYLLIQSIKAASGIATSYIIFHLFDITNTKKILYFSLWSIYGSPSCFSDFNNDGHLDFLMIRKAETYKKDDIYKLTLSTIDYSKGSFTPVNNKKYIVFQKHYNKKNEIYVSIISKKW